MQLKWTCSECHKEQATYLSEADWTIDRDRCNDVNGILIVPICYYCKSEETYEKI